MSVMTSPGTVQVSTLMTENVFSIFPDMTIHDAIGVLLKNRVAGAPVISRENVVISVASEGDLLKIASKGDLHKKVSDCLDRLCLTENLITIKKTDSFAFAYMKFLAHAVHRLIVVSESGHLEGIVSRSNVLNVVYESKKTNF